MNDKGFTLLELFAVIALLSLVAVVAVPQILKTAEEEKENSFKAAVLETFTEALTRLEQNIELSNETGSWNCKDFKYKDKYPFSSCIINWDKANPTSSDLKIDVTSENGDFIYENKTKIEIENND